MYDELLPNGSWKALTKRATFNAIPDETTAHYRGQAFDVVRMLRPDEWEEWSEITGEMTPGALVRFSDGIEHAAYPEEIWEEYSWS